MFSWMMLCATRPDMRGGRRRASIASDVVGSTRAYHGLPIVVHDGLARFLCRFLGSAAASRSHVICVVLCVVSDVNQARREVSWASDLLSCVLRVFGVCSGPFLLFEAGVAVSQGVAYDSPSSQHSTQPQLCCLALGRGPVDCPKMNAVTARGRNDIHCIALRRYCLRHLIGCVVCCVATASIRKQVARSPERLRWNSVRIRLKTTLGGWLSK